MEQAFSAKKKEVGGASNKECSDSYEDLNACEKPSAEINWAKRKATEPVKPSTKTGPSKPKKGLWIGVDLDDSDSGSSSDEETPQTKDKGKGKGKSSAPKAVTVK